ncbi:SDR family NAD(P)-dependent oxidoreductase [Limosilactobacillus difficilis]|uniref:SDR family NAD(P)-dependent oxidoreductase n=1 Tax=Limosilactobacillus difficilis TaxID=2991838 RepID=UPI0024B93B56|nr:SDR family oxidoreductase [Limosilactobacillus difficilis]
MLRRIKSLRKLKNKIVLITGGSRGIGAALAIEAAHRGAIVIVVARNLDRLERVAKRCLVLSGRPAFAFQCDVTDPDAVDKMLDKVRHEVGDIDVLINSAGIGDMREVVKQPRQRVSTMVNVNLLATMYLSRSVAKEMMDQGYGAIINIGSLAGKIPTPNAAAYSATKAGVIQFSNILRMEVADYGIQVLTVNPGPVDTHFFKAADPSGNYLSHLPKSMMISAAQLAQTVWDNVGYKTREINVPGYTAILSWIYQLIPGMGDWTIKKIFDFQQDKRNL